MYSGTFAGIVGKANRVHNWTFISADSADSAGSADRAAASHMYLWLWHPVLGWGEGCQLSSWSHHDSRDGPVYAPPKANQAFSFIDGEEGIRHTLESQTWCEQVVAVVRLFLDHIASSNNNEIICNYENNYKYNEY